MEDIRNTINAGKQVTTHQSQINFKGWKGSGYIILDERTGTGAYLIDGGANGAMVTFFGENQNLIALLLGIASIASLFIPVIGLYVLIFSIFSAFMITMYNNLQLYYAGCEGLMGINWLFNMLALTVGSIFGGSVASTIWTSLLGWIYTAGVSSESVLEFCRGN